MASAGWFTFCHWAQEAPTSVPEPHKQQEPRSVVKWALGQPTLCLCCGVVLGSPSCPVLHIVVCSAVYVSVGCWQKQGGIMPRFNRPFQVYPSSGPSMVVCSFQ